MRHDEWLLNVSVQFLEPDHHALLCPEERDWPVIRRAVIASINTSNSAAEPRAVLLCNIAAAA